jgi:hypothetical protein
LKSMYRNRHGVRFTFIINLFYLSRALGRRVLSLSLPLFPFTITP